MLCGLRVKTDSLERYDRGAVVGVLLIGAICAGRNLMLRAK